MANERLEKAIRETQKRGRHSPAGYKYLQEQRNKQAEPTYFRGKKFARPSIEQQLRDAGISEARIIRMKRKKNKK